MSVSETNIPITFWPCILQVVALIVSPFILTVQRVYQSRHVINPHLKTDTVRDEINAPFSKGTRRVRIVVETLISTMIAGYLLVLQILHGSDDSPLSTYLLIGYGVYLTVWVYCLVLTIVATQNPLPDTRGWILNAHLCALFSVLLVPTTQNLLLIVWKSSSISFLETIPYAVPFFFTLDLFFITVTLNNGPPFLDEHGKQVNGSTVASIHSTSFFTWLTPFIKMVNKRTHEGQKIYDEDLPTLPTTHRAYNVFYVFGDTYGNKLLYRIYRANRSDIISQTCYASVVPLMYYAIPFSLNRLLFIIQEITNEEEDKDDTFLYVQGMGYVLSMAVLTVITDLLVTRLGYYSQSNVELKIKSMLNLEIYKKTLCRMDTSVMSNSCTKSESEANVSVDDENDSSSPTGMIVNLVSSDSARISEFSSWWFYIIKDTLQLVIGICFLYSLLGWSCILGLLCMTITLPLNHFNSKFYVERQIDLMKARDKRVSLMNEVLQGIRHIKFFALESNWTRRILNARDIELEYIKKIYIHEVIFAFLWRASPLLFNIVAFWSFTKLEGKELTAPIAFTCISIFVELRSSMSIIPSTIVHLFEALVSVNRIDKYLSEEEVKEAVHSGSASSAEGANINQPLSSEIKIGFGNAATIGWPSENTKENSIKRDNSTKNFVLKDLDFQFPNSKLSLVCGATGSGKTLMMLSLLGETDTKKGSVYCPRPAILSTLDTSTSLTSIKISQDADMVPDDWILQHAVAYTAQSPWLQNASIKDNILFGLPFVQKRYKATLYACALEKDLSYLEDGDQTEIGENGITLSGGQKARVALARAVYSRAQNVLMDDVLSAVDAHTAKHLYKQCILGPLMKERTQILITHHVKLCIEGSSFIVLIKGGRVELSGSPSELRQSGQLSQIFEENDRNEREIGVVEDIQDTNTIIEEEREVPKDGEDKNIPKVLVEEEERSDGTIEMSIYKLYINLIGKWKFFAFILFTVFGARALNIAASWCLKKWTQSYEHLGEGNSTSTNSFSSAQAFDAPSANYGWPISASPTSGITKEVTTNAENTNNLNMYLGVYILLNFTDLFIVVIRFTAAYAGGLFASKKLHILLLDRIFRAPLRFFDTTPVGRIVNRFSKDFTVIDDAISTNVMEFLVYWTEAISIAIIAASFLPILVFPMLFVIVVNIYSGSQYVSASRELKRLDSISRSPLLTQFSETIVGVTTIRAFGMTQQFMLDMIDRIDANARPMYYAYTIGQWVSIRITLMGSSISFITGIFILMNLHYIDAATAGFCLSYVLNFTNLTYWGVGEYTQMEMDFNAVERVVEYLGIDQEAPSITNIRPPEDWPSEGCIEVKNLSVRYASDLEFILKGLSFSVRSKEKIGIVGRTGSGKSTLALAFFRFVELCTGSIIIDEIDISKLGTEDLRGSLTIIPQDPVLYSSIQHGSL